MTITIKYFCRDFITNLTVAQQRACAQAAGDNWSAGLDVLFVPAATEAEAQWILTVQNNTGEPNTLASTLTFFPGAGTTAINQAFTGATWTTTLLTRTMTHEAGHMLKGTLDHSTSSSSIMYATPTVDVPSSGDISDMIAAGYGAATSTPPPPPPPTVTITLSAPLAAGTYTVTTSMPSTASPDGTRIYAPTTDVVTDNSLSVWNLASNQVDGGYPILRNGVRVAAGAAVELGIKSGMIFVKNNEPRWFKWNGTSWEVITYDPFA